MVLRGHCRWRWSRKVARTDDRWRYPIKFKFFKSCWLLKNVDLIKTQEKIDEIVDENIQILNSSTWDPTVKITIENKDLLISKLIFDELFLKRISQLKSICEEFELFGLLSYIWKYPISCRKIFAADLDPLTAQNILDILVMENEETFEKKQSQFFFLQYVKEADSTKLSDILQFVTGFTRIPPWKWKKVLF